MTYALLGDSQAAGLEPRLRLRLPIELADPRVGWTTSRIRSDGPFEAALGSSASRIVLVTGGNDDPLNAAALVDMIERARARGKSLIVVGPVFALTSDGPRHDRARDALKRTAAIAGARFIDAYPLTRDLASARNVHLTGEGYETYARRLATALQSSTWATLAFAFAAAFGFAYAATRP